MTKRTTNSAAGGWEPPAAESLHPATDLAAASRQLLDGKQRNLDAPALREALSDLHELWLTTKAAELGIAHGSGFALVATGGLAILFDDATETFDIVDADLTIGGLAILARQVSAGLKD